jgi:hypothetical protein
VPQVRFARVAREEDLKCISLRAERVIPAGTDSVIITSDASSIGPRWDTFQDRPRERSKEAVTGCLTGDTNSRADNLRKIG